MTAYTDISGYRKRSALPEALQRVLIKLGEQISEGEFKASDIAVAVEGMAHLPVTALSAALSEIPQYANLQAWYGGWYWETTELPPKARELAALRWIDGLEYLFIFHRNGFLREAALKKITRAVPSAFLFSAVAYRLNDWATPVRQAAVAGAERTFLITDPDVIAAAGEHLLLKMDLWLRGAKEVRALDIAFSREEVLASLAYRLMSADTGTLGRVLKSALRYPGMDKYLASLCTDAVQPNVRALALQALVKGEAVWANGFEVQWIDKSMGMSRLVARLIRRPLTVKAPIAELIRLGAADKAVAVRKVAMQALVDHSDLWPAMPDLVDRFASDKGAGIRAGADYIIRHRNVAG